MAQPYEPKWKQRTHETHMRRDLPRCRDPKQSVRHLLIGSSHFERLISHGLAGDMFVAGVGGDCAEHMLYPA